MMKELKALRYNSNKPTMSMVPLEVVREIAKVFDYGSKKYPERDNWKKGFAWQSLLDSCLRHLTDWQTGNDLDDESKLNNITMALCNLTMLQWYILHPEVGEDDRYKGE